MNDLADFHRLTQSNQVAGGFQRANQAQICHFSISSFQSFHLEPRVILHHVQDGLRRLNSEGVIHAILADEINDADRLPCRYHLGIRRSRGHCHRHESYQKSPKGQPTHLQILTLCHACSSISLVWMRN